MPYVDTTDEFLSKALYDYQLLKGVNFGMSGGICFGSTFCHAVFFVLGKLDWWQEALAALVSWDRKPESLSQTITLSDNKPRSLDAIFRMAAYFLLNHSTIDLTREDYPLDEIKVNVNQIELLQVASTVAIKTDLGNKKIRDKFSFILHGDDDLKAFVNALKVSDNARDILCFAFKSDHATSLRVTDDLYFYNSNYGESRLENLEKGWSHISQIWHTLKLYMKEDYTIGLICVTLDKPIDIRLKQVCEQFNTNALEHINERTIHAVANIKPESIPQLLEKIDKEEASEIAFEKSLAPRKLISSPSTMQTIISCAPNLTDQLLDLINRKPRLKQSLAKALRHKVDYMADLMSDVGPDRADCRTTAEIIMDYAPQSFEKLIDIVSTDAELFKSLQFCLANLDKHGVSFLDRLKAKNVPGLKKCLALLNPEAQGSNLNQVSMFKPAQLLPTKASDRLLAAEKQGFSNLQL